MTKNRYFIIVLWLNLCCMYHNFLYSKSHQHHKIIKKDTSGREFLIYTHSSGMFATMTSILGALNYYEQGKFAGIKVDLFEGAYWEPALGANWWNYFFETINIGKNNEANKRIFTVQEHCLFVGDITAKLSKERITELLHKYVHVKPHILEKVNSFCAKNLCGHHVVGIHYRGTDKITEVPLISYDKIQQAFTNVYDNLSTAEQKNIIVYIATDDNLFLNYMLESLSVPIIYNDFVRSDDNHAVHWGCDDKYKSIYQKGEEALLDCLVLSKCAILIRTSSCLSFMAEYFNLVDHLKQNAPKMIIVDN